MLASRSAIPSDSSINACSKLFNGNEASSSPAFRAESRNDDREDGRSGVVGRGVLGREPDLLIDASLAWVAMMKQSVFLARPEESTLAEQVEILVANLTP